MASSHNNFTSHYFNVILPAFGLTSLIKFSVSPKVYLSEEQVNNRFAKRDSYNWELFYTFIRNTVTVVIRKRNKHKRGKCVLFRYVLFPHDWPVHLLNGREYIKVKKSVVYVWELNAVVFESDFTKNVMISRFVVLFGCSMRPVFGDDYYCDWAA